MELPLFFLNHTKNDSSKPCAIILVILVLGITFPLAQSSQWFSLVSSNQASVSSNSKILSSPASEAYLATAGSTTSSFAAADPGIQVGVFYYPWYGWRSLSATWSGGNGSSHWNDGPLGVAKDQPKIGYYSSFSNSTLGWQITQMQELGINFMIVDWAGWGITDFSNTSYINSEDMAIDHATLNIFKFLQTSGIQNFKVALMVDVFNHTFSGAKAPINSTDYSLIYSYIWNRYYSNYPNLVFNWEGKPLLCWFSSLRPPANSTFTNRIVGQSPGVDWWFWKSMTPVENYTGNVNVENYLGNPVISTDGEVSIIPRYDDYYLYTAGGRAHYMSFDVTYSQQLYAKEWNYVIKQRASINLVLIYSWNEYHERSEIEPHFDYTSSNGDPCYLAELTRYYDLKLAVSSTVASDSLTASSAPSLYCPVLFSNNGSNNTSETSVAHNNSTNLSVNELWIFLLLVGAFSCLVVVAIVKKKPLRS